MERTGIGSMGFYGGGIMNGILTVSNARVAQMSISTLIVVLLLSGCTTVGVHDSAALRSIDFGPQQVVRLCAWLDEGITEVEARELLIKAWKHDASRFELEMQIVRSRPFTRSGFFASAIAAQVIRLPLEDACDRVVVFVGRHAGDVLWGFLGLPEILGWANDVTRTHAYAVTRFGSLQQVLFLTPSGVLRHELLHLLGCEHGWSLSACYGRIAEMKRAKRGDFFPAWDAINQTVLASRASVAATLADRSSGQREAHKARRVWEAGANSGGDAT